MHQHRQPQHGMIIPLLRFVTQTGHSDVATDNATRSNHHEQRDIAGAPAARLGGAFIQRKRNQGDKVDHCQPEEVGVGEDSEGHCAWLHQGSVRQGNQQPSSRGHLLPRLLPIVRSLACCVLRNAVHLANLLQACLEQRAGAAKVGIRFLEIERGAVGQFNAIAAIELN